MRMRNTVTRVLFLSCLVLDLALTSLLQHNQRREQNENEGKRREEKRERKQS